MAEKMMNTLQQRDLETVSHREQLLNVNIIQQSARAWYFTFEACHQSQKIKTYRLRTQRGKPRLWSNPRSLFNFLSQYYAVRTGSFHLYHEVKHDTAFCC